jgi:hypothetical protein
MITEVNEMKKGVPTKSPQDRRALLQLRRASRGKDCKNEKKNQIEHGDEEENREPRRQACAPEPLHAQERSDENEGNRTHGHRGIEGNILVREARDDKFIRPDKVVGNQPDLLEDKPANRPVEVVLDPE